jgi:multicomponent Na+:H+ antiporter subunit C
VSAVFLYAVVGAVLAVLGGLGLVLGSHPVRRIVAVNIMGSGVFLVIIALADRGTDGPDPVPQAMVLTGIVVAVSATAVALALVPRRDDRGDPS